MNEYNKWTIRDTVKFHKIIKDNPQTTMRELSILMGFTVVTIEKKLVKFGYQKGWFRDEKV